MSESLNIHQLEELLANAAIAGSMASMGYFRGALHNPEVHGSQFNASTEADIAATLAILKYIGDRLDPGTLQIYAEELDTKYSKPDVVRRINEEIAHLPYLNSIKRDSKSFIRGFRQRVKKEVISILFDGIDGTTNFRAGFPFFCSAVAAFINDELKVAAIYDPTFHAVYYGSIGAQRRAYLWRVSTGERSKIVAKEETELRVATHCTRSNKVKREEMLKCIDSLIPQCGAHYQINSGQLALTQVAAGIFSGFANNHTNLWDIAAGHVLIEAIGGVVRDFDDKEVNYKSGEAQTGIIAARNQHIYDEMRKAMGLT